MIFGWITRRQYLEHHEPSRWVVAGRRRREIVRAHVSPGEPVVRARSPKRIGVDFDARCDTIEEAYEFMLAYASQGLPVRSRQRHGPADPRIPARCDAALTGFGELVIGIRRARRPRPGARIVRSSTSSSATRGDAQAAIQLVLAQPAISSQLIDNLNASIHLRALLTDLFLIDEALKLHRNAGAAQK